MTVFVDTSALVGLLDHDDPRHDAVVAAWAAASDAARFLTSNYVVVESFAVARRRLGMASVRALHDRLLPLVEVVFVTAAEHEAATAAFLAADRRGLSFVDCASFAMMRRRGIRTALALDADFGRQGFRVLPAP